jgi:protoporphyrinogen/coproporphyrinogen III oxidase
MNTTAARTRVAVIGGGITGLAAAHALLTPEASVAGPGVEFDVTVFEAQDRLGGKIRTSPFAGVPAVDEGPDAFLARLPWATGFARRLGLGDSLVSPSRGSAAVWWHGLQPLPEGLLLGLPTDVMKLARTKLISWPGKVRAATEILRGATSLEADSIGAYVRARFGDEVHERLVDPLVGSIYAADTDRFSLAAVPQLADLAGKGRSVLLTARRAPAPTPSDGPVFSTPSGGLGQLVDVAGARIGDLGGTIRVGQPCTTLEPDGTGHRTGWRVDGESFDAVVLACPAAQAARLLTGTSVADGLARIEYADVVMVTIAVPAVTWPDALRSLSGYLVPKPMQRLVTAASFGSQKWEHWRPPDTGAGEQVVLRISLGRDGLPVMHLDDDQLVAAAVTEVGSHIGVDLQPTAVRLTRWQRAFPQYRPLHHRFVAGLAEELPDNVALAGASYHGIGIPACIRSGEQAANVMHQRTRAALA